MIRFILASILALVFSSHSHGSDKKFFPTEAKSKFDSNNNGEISQMEYMHFHTEQFNKADKNFDSKLTKAETDAANAASREARAKERFLKMDSDKNGALSDLEFNGLELQALEEQIEASTKRSSKLFESIDKDNNGYISRLENDEYVRLNNEKRRERRKKYIEKRFAKLDKNRDGIVQEDEYLDRNKDPQTVQQLLDNTSSTIRVRLDGNGDGDVTRSEHRAYNLDQFKRLDKNDDGVIKKSEARFLFTRE